MNRLLLTAFAVLLALPALAAEPTAKEDFEDIRAELARVERLLAERSSENWGRAQERMTIVREKLGRLSEKLENCPAKEAPKKAEEKVKNDKPPLEKDTFEQLRSRMKDARNDSLRNATLQTQLSTAWFTAEQALVLLRTYKLSADRFAALELIAPRLSDRKNGLILQDAFKLSSDKERALKLVSD